MPVAVWQVPVFVETFADGSFSSYKALLRFLDLGPVLFCAFARLVSRLRFERNMGFSFSSILAGSRIAQ
jgi:hypothetical protein